MTDLVCVAVIGDAKSQRFFKNIGYWYQCEHRQMAMLNKDKASGLEESSGFWPYFDSEQRTAVEQVLRSGKVNYWTGKECRLFEEEIAAFLGVNHATAVCNGTVAIELILQAAGVGSGDEVIVPSRTFIGTASAVVVCGATPIIADVDPVSQCLTAATIAERLTSRTKAIIAVHLGGWPCEMDEIMRLARANGLFVLEDCAQAHGAIFKGKRVGSLGDASAFSFCQDKIMSLGGEGGVIATNDTTLWRKIWSKKDHGKSYELAHSPNPSGAFRYLHESFGTNARMTEMQAAIGRIQLRRLDGWLDCRADNANYLVEELGKHPAIRFHRCPGYSQNAYYRLYGFLTKDALQPGWCRDRILKRLNELGESVGCGSSGEIYREKAFGIFPPVDERQVAKRLHESSLAFSVHPTLTRQMLMKSVSRTISVLNEACGFSNPERAVA